MADTSLRPRSVTEIVDAAVQLFRRHYVSFIIVSGVGMAPWLVLRPILVRLTFNSDPLGFGLWAMVDNIVTWVCFSIAGGAIVAAASQAYLEGRVDTDKALQRSLKRLGAVMGTSFVKAFAIGLGLILVLVGALYMYATYFAVPTTVIVEDKKAGPALDRSRELAMGNRWHILGTMLLVGIVYFVVLIGAGAVTAMVAGGPSSIVAQILSTVITILVYPIIPITEMLVYYDLRIRKEGYDVELMASQVGAAPPPGTP